MKAMDSEGTDCQVMYANTTGVSGDRFQGLDPEFEAACVRVYNDYQTEEWSTSTPTGSWPSPYPSTTRWRRRWRRSTTTRRTDTAA